MSLVEQALNKAAAARAGGATVGSAAQAPSASAPSSATTRLKARLARTRTSDADPTRPTHVLRALEVNHAIAAASHAFLDLKDPAATRGYKILRTRVLHRLAQSGWWSVAVSGTRSGEGKSLTAMNLALALAQDPNTHVCLLDLDLQRSRIASFLGIRPDLGLADYLAGKCEIEDVSYDIGVERFSVIPNTHSAANSSELLASTRMADLLVFLQRCSPQPIVIADLPPLQASDDAITILPKIDSCLLVVSEGETQRRALEGVQELLADVNLIGVVLNRSLERNDSDYY